MNFLFVNHHLQNLELLLLLQSPPHFFVRENLSNSSSSSVSIIFQLLPPISFLSRPQKARAAEVIRDLRSFTGLAREAAVGGGG